MRLLLFFMLIISANQAFAETIILRCPNTDKGLGEKIYKYVATSFGTNIFERRDAAWIEWCQSRSLPQMKENGWGEEIATLSTTELGASCVSLIPLIPTTSDHEMHLYQGVSYVARFETIIDFQFLKRTVKQEFVRISEGMQPKILEPSHYSCVLFE